jgi:hypothetical protein
MVQKLVWMAIKAKAMAPSEDSGGWNGDSNNALQNRKNSRTAEIL